MDIWSNEKRSDVMSKIRSKNTKPEMILRSALHRKGFRFRVHDKKIPGKPDIVLKKYNTVIFVNGCFWHFHEDCREGRIPNTNTKFWKTKLKNNIDRDKKNQENCLELDWKVVVIWECELETKLDSVLFELEMVLKNHSQYKGTLLLK